MFCAQCGTKNDDNAKFCASCGTTIAGTVSSPTQNQTTQSATISGVQVPAPPRKISWILIFGGGFIGLLVLLLIGAEFGLVPSAKKSAPTVPTSSAAPAKKAAAQEESKAASIRSAAVREALEHRAECVFLYDSKLKLMQNSGEDKKPENAILLSMMNIYFKWHLQQWKDLGISENYPQEEANKIVDSVNGKYLSRMKNDQITPEFLDAINALIPGCSADWAKRKTE